MSQRVSVQKRIDKDFAKLLDEIKLTRVKLSKDTPNNIKADWRITLAIARHPLIIKIKEDIINAELK